MSKARVVSVAMFVLCVGWPAGVAGQKLTQRGFVEATTFWFPQAAPNDDTRVIGDVLAREEAFLKPAPWIQVAGGIDLRASSHDQVEDSWQIDVSDRTIRRPRLSLRRATATVTRGRFTLDAGKQFIRWGKADILTPTDRFAPRDFLNVVESEFLPVLGIRGVVQAGSETLEAVWTPRFTPSRVPLVNQRWTVVPPVFADVNLVNAPLSFPDGAQAGVRWGHVGTRFEYSASFFDGFNHLPNVEPRPIDAALIAVEKTYPAIRMYGADAAVPTRWLTIKGEAAYFTSPSLETDEYVLYVIQLERQTGEWVIVGGYAGEAVTSHRAGLAFAPDRGVARSIVARAAYTIDANRSVAFETALRQNGDGLYAKAEYSIARGQHWRTTVKGALIAGEEHDFLGQYHRNSHAALTLRYSF